MTEEQKRQPSETLLEEIRRMGGALVHDALYAMGFRKQYMGGIAPIISGSFAGPAVTLRYVPRREDFPQALRIEDRENAAFKSIEVSKRGDVIVCDCGGYLGGSTFGDIMTLRSQIRGVAAIVVDGAVRDIPGLKPLEVPIYAKGIQCYGQGVYPADFNVPISCGGVAVLPGDIIVGDEDGVVVIPKQVVEDVFKLAQEKEEAEAQARKRLTEDGAAIHEIYPSRKPQ